ncbi:ureidoglycolate lyase [Tardiphaga sp.]|uniref:ureidoglycolate lyase n=1 Tax=Tardiphaga sp. TaxID=1926292 RepID=UPI0025D10D65|nr:ureidoglycolate lyase [Tardiphaga sp.]
MGMTTAAPGMRCCHARDALLNCEIEEISMPTSRAVPVEVLSDAAFEPFGWVLGQPHPLEKNPLEFRSPATDFWHEHFFDPGTGGDTEVLWVAYRDATSPISRLEVHHLTQQAVIPLRGDIIQILCLSDDNQAPDLSTLRAYQVSPGIGICMRPGVWHTTRAADATCMMLTRRSTTADLVDHLNHASPARESTLLEIPPHDLIRKAG